MYHMAEPCVHLKALFAYVDYITIEIFLDTSHGQAMLLHLNGCICAYVLY